MKVELTNKVEPCPQPCDDFEFILDELNQYDRRHGGNIHVLVDCAHSAVCKFRGKEDNDGEIPQETR